MRRRGVPDAARALASSRFSSTVRCSAVVAANCSAHRGQSRGEEDWEGSASSYVRVIQRRRLEEARRELKISPAEFDEVAAGLGNLLARGSAP